MCAPNGIDSHFQAATCSSACLPLRRENVLDPLVSLTQQAAMVMRASGSSGARYDYVRQTFMKLSSIGIDDPGVTALWNAVRDARNEIAGSHR